MQALYILYLIVLLLASVAGLYRFASLDRASKVLCFLIGFTFLAESAAYYAAAIYKNNMPVYTVANILQMVLLCLYFNYCIDVFFQKKVGIWLAGVSIIAGLVNAAFFLQDQQLAHYFLVYSAVTVTAMSLFALFRFFAGANNLRLSSYPHFWFMVILVSFWTLTFMNWALYEYFKQALFNQVPVLNLFIILVNIITYSSFSIVFLLYPKLNNQSYE